MKIKNKFFTLKYNSKSFPFKKIFENHLSGLNVKKLEKVHEQVPKKFVIKKKINSVKSDQKFPIYEFLYKIYENKKKVKKKLDFLIIYEEFIKFLSQKIFKESLIYQKKPTLRIMFPKNRSVAQFHRDREYNHPIEEINVWVPVTEAKNSNTLWIESAFEKADFRPVNLKYGEFLIFDSGLMHGNKINKENKTRLSFDFRVIPLSIWKKRNIKMKIKASLDQKIKFDIGDYYNFLKYKKSK